MKLWLLRPLRYDDEEFWRETHSHAESNPWSPWYDKTFGRVVRAASETEARHIAAAEEHDEEWGRRAWLDPAKSSCTELTQDGPAGAIIADVHHA